MAAEYYQSGLQMAEIGIFDPETGAGTDFVDLEIYEGTMKFTGSQPNKTKHYQAGRKAPRKVSVATVEVSAEASVMNVGAESMAKVMNGTVTTVNGVKRFNPDETGKGQKIAFCRFTTLDGGVLYFPRGLITAVPNFDGNKDGLHQLSVSFEPTDTGINAVPSWYWDEETPVTTPGG